MIITFLDLELLQPANTICEIGAVALDTNKRQVVSCFQSLALPPGAESWNPEFQLRKCGKTLPELTGISREMLSHAPKLDVVATEFWGWFPGGRLAGWGDDAAALVGQCPPPEAAKVWPVNLKPTCQLLRSAFPGKSKGGLQAALTQAGLGFVGTPHRAFWDAYNLARLFWYYHRLLKLGQVAEHSVNYLLGDKA